MHHHNHSARGRFALIHVQSVLGHEVLERATRDGIVAAAPVCEAAQIVECLILQLGATCGGKLVVAVTRKSAGNVLAHTAIGNFAVAVHKQLGSIVDLGNAARCEQECHSLLPREQILGKRGEEAVGVVVVEESEHVLRVFIEIVERQTVVDVVQSVSPWERGGSESLRSHEHEREVHHSGKIGASLEIEAAAVLPESSSCSFAIPTFTHDVVAGIFLLYSLYPISHSEHIGVGVSVHANAVDAAVFNPPDRILY